MKNSILVIFLVIILIILGYFTYSKYFKEIPVRLNENTAEEVNTKDVKVTEFSFSNDIDKNIEELDKELEGLDVDKDFADFNDLNW